MARGSAVFLWLGGVLLLVGGWAWMASPQGDEAQAAASLAAPSAARRETHAAKHAAPPTEAADPQRFERWLNERSSLRGTDLDGSWDIDGQGRLVPTIGLRRRFDQLLTLSGETPLGEITAFIERDVRELVGAAGAAAVLDAWDRYLELQRYPWRTPVKLGDNASLAASLAERQQVRRRILGVEIAHAFYAEDDVRLQALLASPEAPPPAVQTTRIDRSQLGPAALARLRAEEAAWADWQQRLEAARREVASLQAAPELSPLQRDQAIARLIAQRFDVQEAVRVRALLHLSPAS